MHVGIAFAFLIIAIGLSGSPQLRQVQCVLWTANMNLDSPSLVGKARHGLQLCNEQNGAGRCYMKACTVLQLT